MIGVNKVVRDETISAMLLYEIPIVSGLTNVPTHGMTMSEAQEDSSFSFL